MTELERRRLVVHAFAMTALTGDTDAFTRNTVNIDWPGAWLEIFTALAPIPRALIDDDIRRAFSWAWRGGFGSEGKSPIGINWSLTKDLDGHQDLLIAGLKLMLTPYSDPLPPRVLYRGQSLTEHQRGSYGPWWTPYPHIAEWFARSAIRDHTGARCIVATFRPERAFIHQPCTEEILLDPRQINHVELIAMPPPYAPGEEDEATSTTSILRRIPHGYANDVAEEWWHSIREAREAV